MSDVVALARAKWPHAASAAVMMTFAHGARSKNKARKITGTPRSVHRAARAERVFYRDARARVPPIFAAISEGQTENLQLALSMAARVLRVRSLQPNIDMGACANLRAFCYGVASG